MNEVCFKGTVERGIYLSENFKVYALDVSRKDYPQLKRTKYGNVSILGDLPELIPSVEYEVEGTEEQSKYGSAYRVSNIKREIPKTQIETKMFLMEILTPNQAETLYNVYPDIIDRVKNNRLDDIDLNKLKGIKEYTFNIIKEKIIENFCLADLVIEFQGYLSMSVIRKLYEKYHSVDTIRYQLKKDPYKALCALAGIGFKKADAILLKLDEVSKKNIKIGKRPIICFDYDLKTSVQRCLACVTYLLQENENSGHTRMSLIEARKQCYELTPSYAEHFTEAIKDDTIYYNKDNLKLALSLSYNLEKKIATTIKENINNENVWNYDVSKYSKVSGIELSPEQMKIVENVCKHTICILNGAAGTGKSFSTQAIINMLKDHGKTFKLFSPTGKAAKVLSEYTGEEASTIHRGLCYIPPSTWGYNKDNKLTEDIIIIDEFSMVDVYLFYRVLDAIDLTKTKLVLIGDNAQLPSVSCGNLLHDFMQSKIIPTVTLTKVFRYNEGGLMKVATDVRNTQQYLTPDMKGKATIFGDNKDYTFIDLPSEDIPAQTVLLYKKLLKDGYKVSDIQVLTAQNVRDCGAIALNNMIQKVANPNCKNNKYLQIGDVKYYEGDLVIQKVNNYKACIAENMFGLYEPTDETAFVANGETGIVKEVSNTHIIIDFDGILVYYNKPEAKDIGLGYSITVHKSQGSGIKIVILCTPKSHTYMLNSNLVYVGLTRMKEKCFHLGTLSTVNKVIKKKANFERDTFMQELLAEKN